MVHDPAGLLSDTHTGALTAPAGATCVSVGATPVNVWLPVLVTVNVSVMTCPTAFTLAGLAVLPVVKLFAAVTSTLTGVDGGLVTGVPVGVVPVLVAASFTLPLSRSAWVTVYVAVN